MSPSDQSRPAPEEEGLLRSALQAEMSRRRLLGLLAGTLASYGLVPLRLPGRAPALGVGRDAVVPNPRPTPVPTPVTVPPSVPTLLLTATVARRLDMLSLTFSGYNLTLDTSGGSAVLTRADAELDAYLVVGFPPQAVLEGAVAVGATPPIVFPGPPLPANLSGISQLAFLVPPGVPSIPFTLESLLDWSGLEAQWESAPLPSSGPGDFDTYIEAPWHLLLSPDGTASWSHSSNPVTYAGRTELWQTRLGDKGIEPPLSSPQLRAVWTPNYPTGLPDLFGPSYVPSLLNADRLDIIALTCGVSFPGAVIEAVPAVADLFMLTALGASLNVHGTWDTPSTSSLTDWRHRMVTGRESYVRTVRAGFLFPFGHRAVHITITDREFQVDRSGNTLAYLVQRQYVVVVQPTRDYEGLSYEPYGGRQNPLRQVTVKTLATPPLDPMSSAAQVSDFPTSGDDEVFWVRVNGADYPFAFNATDLENRSVPFSIGAIFVSEEVAYNSVTIKSKTYSPSQSTERISSAYAAADPSRRSPGLGGQLLAFAKPGSQPGSTAQHADSLELGAAPPQGTLPALQPPFFPIMASAQLRLPGAEQIAGSSLGSVLAKIHSNYYLDDFKAGVAQVYLELSQGSQPIPLGFSPNLSGGIATPNLGITGLARDLGPVAGSLSDLLAGKFDPKSFFQTIGSALEAKLLGAISLWDILSSAGLSGSPSGVSATGQAPRLDSTLIYPNNDSSQPPQALQTTFDWLPAVQGDPLGFFVPNDGATLTVHAVVYTPIKSPQQTTYTVHGQLTNFDLVLFGSASSCIDLAFNGVTFDFATGAKTNITPDISGVTFVGPLTFIQDFEQFFSSLGGPTIDVTAAGITASYSLALPSVSLGVFSLQNLSLSGSLNIPFDSTPVRLRVDFCTRENPFLLSIDLFTGGGFFGIALGADGIELIEVSLEFGASLSIDLGVASGGVSIMAGIYFALQTAPTSAVQLTGFLRADGNLSVLGIISLSIEFYLGFTYLNPGQAYGIATVTVEVSVLCFSTSVSMTMEKTLGGSDPTFAQAITTEDWKEYCLAFA